MNGPNQTTVHPDGRPTSRPWYGACLAHTETVALDERGHCPACGAAERRERVYTLHFDDGVKETVTATSPAEAVAQRYPALMPYQITDETAMAEWVAKRQTLVLERTAAIARKRAERLARLDRLW